MDCLADTLLPPRDDDSGSLARALSRVRWVAVVALLLLAAARPLPGRTLVPTWTLVLAFALYNVLVDLLRARVPWMRSFARIAFLDLPVTLAIYAQGAMPGGVLFPLVLLTTFCAAASTTPRGSALYIGATCVAVALIAPTFPLWGASEGQVRELGAQLVVLVVVGVTTTILVHELRDARSAARAERAEAGRLEGVARARKDFIASVSHDLRTPLTAAQAGLGMLDVSAGSRLTRDERGLLSTARRNVERLGVLIDDLLTFNRLQGGELQIELESIDLRSVIAEAVQVVQPLLREKGQHLEVHVPSPLGARVDPRRMEQVLVNLLANGSQHTPGGTRITLSGEVAGGVVLLSVADDGPGIPNEEQAAIFERFQRVTPAPGGWGLGLAIARAMVELHGGRLWVESEEGRGAAFHVSLPHHDVTERP